MNNRQASGHSERTFNTADEIYIHFSQFKRLKKFDKLNQWSIIGAWWHSNLLLPFLPGIKIPTKMQSKRQSCENFTEVKEMKFLHENLITVLLFVKIFALFF